MKDDPDMMEQGTAARTGPEAPAPRPKASASEELPNGPRLAGGKGVKGETGSSVPSTIGVRGATGAAEGEKTPKLGKPPKPTHPEFLDLVKQALGMTPPVKGVQALQKLLKAGVNAKTSLGPLLNDLFSLLRDWPESSRLALQLSVQTRSKRLSDLVRSLRNRLIAHSRTVVGYPESTDATGNQEQSDQAVAAWLDRYLSPRPSAGTERAETPDLNWARWAAVCLMEETPVVRIEGVYRLLEALCPKHPAFDPSEAEVLFFTEVASILGTAKPKARAAAGLKFASGSRSLGASMRTQLRAVQENFAKQSAQLNQLHGTAKRLEDELGNASLRISELEAQLQQANRHVEDQRRERTLDKEHQEALAEQHLTRILTNISGRLSHEIAEAKICLDGDTPNIRMALDRLRQVEKALATMKES